MKNMGIKLYQPHIPTIFGEGAINELGNAIRQIRRKKPLLIYGKGTKAAGIAEKAEKSLEKKDIEYVVFDHTKPDPDSTLVDEVVMKALSESCDCVIGLGGGSNLDLAKATSIMMGIRGKMSDILKDHAQFFDAAVPIILVPTTAGSGSEATNAAVIINSKTGLKVPSLVNSTLAIVDPELTYSVSPGMTAMTGMDALSHAVEGMLGIHVNERVELYAVASIKKIMKYLPIAVFDGGDKEAREQLAYASNWAGRVAFDSAPNLGHAMSEGFLQAKSLPHGLPCAWALPEVISFAASHQPKQIEKIAKAMGVFKEGENAKVLAENCAETVRGLMKKINIPTPQQQEIDKQKIMNNPQLKIVEKLGYPMGLSENEAELLMIRAYDGYK